MYCIAYGDTYMDMTFQHSFFTYCTFVLDTIIPKIAG